MKIIDSHLHVWANAEESKTFPYASDDQIPPPNLQEVGSTDALLKQMNEAGVDGALIVQPINHKYDHRYVSDAIQKHPDKFKGMMLFDPSLNPEDALQRLDELVLQGFVGVRFNPYLFDGKMSENEASLKVFKRCAELKLPIGIMCFKGIELHFDDICVLCEKCPETMVILDHFGFAAVDNQEQFDKVLALAKYNVFVKISALFRLKDKSPFESVQKDRFEPLLNTYGADRMLFGTDFPYVTQEDIGYKGAVETVNSWLNEKSEDEKNAVMGGTCEHLFGVWGK